jgi:D-alanyl-D-alanine carboxypeptidase/D-alanyl-D-alanine-endopeptidase (penicillin-binding protein 4)
VPLVILAVVTTLVLAGGLYAGIGAGRQYLADRAFHPIVVPAPTAAPAGAVSALAGVTAAPSVPTVAPAGPAPTAAGVAKAIAPALAASGLGPSVAAQVYDAASGTALVNNGAGTLVAPASTSKLLAAAAVLTVHRATDRFTTTVVAGAAAGSVVIIGGGDPTLSAARPGQPTEYLEAARISDLAAQARTALAGAPVTSVVVDDSLFTGPDTATGWAAEDAPSSYASPITALMADGGRDTPTAAIRSGSPDLAAGQALAADLGATSVTRGSAPVGAAVLATVRSAPVGSLVEQMLTDSDNVLAEVLARQVALATKRPASFVGGAQAIAATLTGLGIAVGTGMVDGSGLSSVDRIPAGVLCQVLLKAVGAQHPELHPIVAGLSVAGWDGTLLEQGRFTGAAASANGVVRAKTGSLTGVSSLAGILTDADSRLLVFAFVADKVPGGDADSPAARTALDQAAAALVGCGCR